MNPKTGKSILTAFFLAAVPACLYPIYDSIVVISEINNGAPELGFDTGVFYLFFMSLMMTIKIVEWLAIKSPSGFAANNAGAILLSNFIIIAILAPTFSFGMVWHLESSGYVQCADPESISRISRGDSYIFRQGSCHVAVDKN
jgi:hypothetical protein